jgi:hypothetical protein
MLTIHQRPFDPEDRSQAGHGEGDLIIGKEQGSAIGTLVERQTRTVRLLHLPQRDSDTLYQALTTRMADLPAALLRSITWDQGTEMARHITIAKSLGAPIYFCDSHSPWQRGTNENTNAVAAVLPTCMGSAVTWSDLLSVACRRTPAGLTRVLAAAVWLARFGCVAPAGVRSRLDSTEA